MASELNRVAKPWTRSVVIPWWVPDPDAYRKNIEAQRRARRRRRRRNPVWEEMTNVQRRGLIFSLHCDGLDAAAIARQLLLSRSYVHGLLCKIWRRIHFRADAIFFPDGDR
jgi:site-specific recombinase XerC